VKPGRARGDRELGVRIGWRRNRYRVDSFERDNFPERRARMRHVGARGTASGSVGVATDERNHIEPRPAQRRHVDPATKAGADHGRSGH
jgi:hypothetical protein